MRSVSISSILFMRVVSMRILLSPPTWGGGKAATAPLPPLGTMGVLVLLASFTISETSSVVPGLTIMPGVFPPNSTSKGLKRASGIRSPGIKLFSNMFRLPIWNTFPHINFCFLLPLSFLLGYFSRNLLYPPPNSGSTPKVIKRGVRTDMLLD